MNNKFQDFLVIYSSCANTIKRHIYKKNEWNVRMCKLYARMRLAYLKDRRNF